MNIKHDQKGSSLMEVLISLCILATTGTFMMGFLFKNATTNKAWIDNYGQELSKIILLSKTIENDTTFENYDENGIFWETKINAYLDDEEKCFTAVSIRLKKDTTNALYYCKYGINTK